LAAVRIPAGGADLLLGCDMVVAASAEALSRVEVGVSRAVINSYLQPTAGFVMDPDIDFETATMRRALRSTVGEGRLDFVEATTLATALIGDAIATNLFVLGYAFQKGLVPLGLTAIERAIELNGAAVDASERALAWGRVAAHDLGTVMAAAGPLAGTEYQPPQRTLGEAVDRHASELSAYQNAVYAQRYRDFVREIETAEKARGGGLGGLTEAVAHNLFKLMAYKDEYEVARLYTNGDFLEKLKREFDGNFRLEFHLAPPFLAPPDPTTGHRKKKAFGLWMFTAFKLLAALKHLRGTPFDPFGRTEERRTERRLINDYKALVENVAGQLTPTNHALAIELARLPEQIRGFGHVKAENLARAKKEEAEVLARFERPGPAAIAAE